MNELHTKINTLIADYGKFYQKSERQTVLLLAATYLAHYGVLSFEEMDEKKWAETMTWLTTLAHKEEGE